LYSLFLKKASKVFNTMLGPHFSEGQILGDKILREILLPNDDAEAMAIIFNILHGQNNAIRESPDPEVILRVAIAVDRFGCTVPLAYAIKVWLNCVNVTDDSKLWRLMTAAYWFDNAKAFKEISLALILHYKESYLQLVVQGVIDTDFLMRACGKSASFACFGIRAKFKSSLARRSKK
jgi:hypothetical protein